MLEEYLALHSRSAELHKQAVHTFPNGVTHDIRLLLQIRMTFCHPTTDILSEWLHEALADLGAEEHARVSRAPVTAVCPECGTSRRI